MSDPLLTLSYRIGGRGADGTIDCLGVVLALAARRGMACLVDPWTTIREAWLAGRFDPSGFPPCWARAAEGAALLDLDVLLMLGEHPWSAIVDGGMVWTAHPDAGVYATPVRRWSHAVVEHWRHDPVQHQARAAW